MPTLRERQEQFEHDLFAGSDSFVGIGSKQKQEQKRNINTNNLIGKEAVKEQIREHRRQLKPPKEGVKLFNKDSSRLQGEDIKLKYLYDTKQSHPVIEFKPSKDELKAASITPSFVLEVTWPRVIQFYHPSSPHCQDLHNTYVALARSVKRRSSRLPVEFHAVNCGVYMDVCSQGFNIKSVPSFLGLKSGSIEGKQIFLPGDNEGKLTSKAEIAADINEKVEYISDVLGFTLDPVKGQSSAFASEVRNNAQFSDNMNVERAIDVPFSGNASSGQSQSEQVFQDATSSLFATLSTSTYSSSQSSLPAEESHILSEFIDLLRWAFPPETKVHTLAEELKQEFNGITTNEEGLLKLLSRHMNLEDGVSWSERCTGHDDPYSCGIWSLLHIISIGVAERHTSVVGDAGRVSVQYAGQSIRAFIEAFYIGCDSCKKSWVELYEEACCGVHSSDTSLVALPHQMAGGVEEQWKQLSIWIWEVHNEINIRRQHKRDQTTLLWPLSEECPKCWPSENGVAAARQDSFDQEALYLHLKRTYWISGHHNNRLVVIDRWNKAKRALSMKRLRDRMAAREFSIVGAFMRFLLIYILLRVAVQMWARWSRHHHARRIKRRSEKPIRDREDDESNHFSRNKSSLTSRSRRSGSATKRWPTHTNTKRPTNTNALMLSNDNTHRRHRSDYRQISDSRYKRYSPLHL